MASTTRCMRRSYSMRESADATAHPHAAMSTLDGGVDHVAQHRAIRHALLRRLHHEDDEQVVARIDPEVGAAGAAPVVVAWRARVRRLAAGQPRRESETEAIARSGQIERGLRHRAAQMVA